jgi:hypothetical protein
MGISLHRSPAGELGAGEYLPGTMRDVWRMALETEHLLTTEALQGEPGGLLYWGSWRTCKGRFLKWALST